MSRYNQSLHIVCEAIDDMTQATSSFLIILKLPTHTQGVWIELLSDLVCPVRLPACCVCCSFCLKCPVFPSGCGQPSSVGPPCLWRLPKLLPSCHSVASNSSDSKLIPSYGSLHTHFFYLTHPYSYSSLRPPLKYNLEKQLYPAHSSIRASSYLLIESYFLPS